MEETITWDDYFMGMALMASKRSKDNRTKVLNKNNLNIIYTNYYNKVSTTQIINTLNK